MTTKYSRVHPVIRISGLCATIACTLLLSACDNSPEPTPEKKVESKVDASLGADNATMVLDIEGMTCDGCANGVAKKLEAVPAIQKLNVSFADGKAYIKCDPKQCDGKVCREAVADAGFTAKLAGADDHATESSPD